MSAPLKPGSIQAHQLFLYSRAIHPGLLPIKSRRVTKHADYELEVWALDGGHLLRFEHTTLCCCELLTAQETTRFTIVLGPQVKSSRPGVT